MVRIEDFSAIAMNLPHVSEVSRFEKTSFQVNKKIVTTLNSIEKRATIKLSEIDQELFCLNKNFMFLVPNKWEKQGCTHMNFNEIPLKMCKDALKTSYFLIALKKFKTDI